MGDSDYVTNRLTDQYAAPQAVTNETKRHERGWRIIIIARVRVSSGALLGVAVVAPSADSEVDNVEDDAKSSSNDKQCTDDSRLTTSVSFHNGRRLSDVHWLHHTWLLDHYLLLLRMRLHLDTVYSKKNILYIVFVVCTKQYKQQYNIQSYFMSEYTF